MDPITLALLIAQMGMAGYGAYNQNKQKGQTSGASAAQANEPVKDDGGWAQSLLGGLGGLGSIGGGGGGSGSFLGNIAGPVASLAGGLFGGGDKKAKPKTYKLQSEQNPGWPGIGGGQGMMEDTDLLKTNMALEEAGRKQKREALTDILTQSIAMMSQPGMNNSQTGMMNMGPGTPPNPFMYTMGM